MDKTIVVEIRTRVRHPLYGKIMNRTTTLKAHDEKNECGIGDTVRVMENPPAVQGQALAPGRNHREGEVITSTGQFDKEEKLQ
jgi:Ribosomal protein S17